MDTTTKKAIKKLDQKICCVKGQLEEPLQGFLSMEAAAEALGLGKMFYYLDENTDEAVPGTVAITIQ
jgi:hypothetical protein